MRKLRGDARWRGGRRLAEAIKTRKWARKGRIVHKAQKRACFCGKIHQEKDGKGIAFFAEMVYNMGA